MTPTLLLGYLALGVLVLCYGLARGWRPRRRRTVLLVILLWPFCPTA